MGRSTILHLFTFSTEDVWFDNLIYRIVAVLFFIYLHFLLGVLDDLLLGIWVAVLFFIYLHFLQYLIISSISPLGLVAVLFFIYLHFLHGTKKVRDEYYVVVAVLFFIYLHFLHENYHRIFVVVDFGIFCRKCGNVIFHVWEKTKEIRTN